MNKEICIQKKIGSCLGCPILESSIGVIQGLESQEQKKALSQISKDNCPDNAGVVIPSVIKKSEGRIQIMNTQNVLTNSWHSSA